MHITLSNHLWQADEAYLTLLTLLIKAKVQDASEKLKVHDIFSTVCLFLGI